MVYIHINNPKETEILGSLSLIVERLVTYFQFVLLDLVACFSCVIYAGVAPPVSFSLELLTHYCFLFDRAETAML